MKVHSCSGSYLKKTEYLPKLLQRNDLLSLPCSCIKCGHYLGLNATRLFNSKEYFPAGNKGTLSFQVADERYFVQKQESTCGPFFESVDSWGIGRNRTALFCARCNAKVSLSLLVSDFPLHLVVWFTDFFWGISPEIWVGTVHGVRRHADLF